MIMQFPILSPDPVLKLYTLLVDYECPEFGTITPGGFRYDGASIPTVFWGTICSPFDPMIMAPALEHDCDYLFHRTSRKKADEKLWTNCIRNGFSQETADLIYKGVRVGGGSHWDWKEKDIVYLKQLFEEIKDRENFDKYLFPIRAINL